MGQGKRDSQVKDSENFAFWGLICLFVTVIILFVVLKDDGKSKENYPPRSLRDTTIEFLKRDRDSLVNISDSLLGELFPTQIELNRYQVAYKIFLKRDPQGAKIFGDIISDETE
jgi:hypothetical protein